MRAARNGLPILATLPHIHPIRKTPMSVPLPEQTGVGPNGPRADW